MENLFDLSGKTAIVTGASSGLGVQLAKALARQGADITIVARRFNKLQKVSKKIEEKFGVDCLPLKCDVTKENDIKNAVNSTIEKYGKIDILVNNAGVVSKNPTEELTIDDWESVIDVNLTGVFLFAKHVGKHMKKNKYGRIINISSVLAEIATPFIPLASYHASKGGVTNLTRALAGEWASDGISVNAIGPGFFESEMTENLKKNEKFNRYLKAHCPMGRPGKKEELDGVVAFLASDCASYITGQIIYVDGGWTAV